MTAREAVGFCLTLAVLLVGCALLWCVVCCGCGGGWL